MGAAFADYDNDGLPDLVITNLALEKWAVYRNDGGGRFSYATMATGMAALTARTSGWGVGLYDFDNDGWKDVFAARSHVLDNVERINPSLHYLEAPALFCNVQGKTFETCDLGPLPAVAGRGAAVGDLNNDGVLDAVVAVLGGRPLVIFGAAECEPLLTLELSGTRGNRGGIGARCGLAGSGSTRLHREAISRRAMRACISGWEKTRTQRWKSSGRVAGGSCWKISPPIVSSR